MATTTVRSATKTHVSLRSAWPDPLWRQVPPKAPYQDDYIFDLANNALECDVCVVMHDVSHPVEVTCNHGITALLTCEPAIIRDFYPPGFADQFDVLLTCREDMQHPHAVRTPPMIPWWVGVTGGHASARDVSMTYSDFARPIDPATKTQNCSLICSNKTATGSHRERVAFVEELCKSPAVDRFGYGFKDLTDKWEALEQYRVHVAIENSSSRDYWTEKASDAFLAESFLIYSGCPNLDEYFPSDSFLRIDMADPKGALAVIEQATEPGFYESRLPAIREAKRRVLEEYNLFPGIARLLSGIEKKPSATKRILPQQWFKGGRRKIIRHRIRQAIDVFQ